MEQVKEGKKKRRRRMRNKKTPKVQKRHRERERERERKAAKIGFLGMRISALIRCFSIVFTAPKVETTEQKLDTTNR